jgi:hypothetical protein
MRSVCANVNANHMAFILGIIPFSSLYSELSAKSPRKSNHRVTKLCIGFYFKKTLEFKLRKTIHPSIPQKLHPQKTSDHVNGWLSAGSRVCRLGLGGNFCNYCNFYQKFRFHKMTSLIRSFIFILSLNLPVDVLPTYQNKGCPIKEL